MSCDDVQRLLGAWQDGELPDEVRERLEAHLHDCRRCRQVRRALAEVSGLVRAAAQPTVPEDLRQRVLAALRASSATGAAAPPARTMLAPLLSAAAGAAAAAVITYAVVSAIPHDELASGQPEREVVSAEVVSAHVRSLVDAQASRIASDDPHRVRPWFAGRLPFAPPSPDFSAEGYPLLGARLDYLGERLVAVLNYRRRQHAISVFVWPADGDADGDEEKLPAPSSHRGYNLVRWEAGDLRFTAVSDLNPAELNQLSALFRKQRPEPQRE